MIRRITVLASTSVLVLALAGCGAIAEQVTEKAIEEGIEAEGGGDVDLDFDGENGSLSVESSEGSFSVGTDQDVPDDFPADVPLPEDATVVMSMNFDDGTDAGFNLTLESAGDVAAIADDIEGGLTRAGYDLTNTGEMTTGEDLTRTVQFEGPGWSGNIVVSDTPDATVVSYNVATSGA